MISRRRPPSKKGNEGFFESSPESILLSLGVCAFAFCAGIFYQAVANLLYTMANQIAPELSIPPPNIPQALLPEMIREVLFSPTHILQVIKEASDLKGTMTSADPFRAVRLFAEMVSVLNIFVSWRYKIYALSVVVSVSLVLAYLQAEILLVKYIAAIVSTVFEHVFGPV